MVKKELFKKSSFFNKTGKRTDGRQKVEEIISSWGAGATPLAI
jgi:hypothetical protein